MSTHKLFPYVFILFLLPQALPAQQARFSTQNLELGDMRQNERAAGEFTVYNDGRDTLHLAPPRPTCGCTAAILSNAKLAPGDSARVSVEFRSGVAMIGPVSKSIQMGRLIAGKEYTIGSVRVSVNVVGAIRYEPGIIEFRSVIGDTVRARITVTSNSDSAITLLPPGSSLMAYVDTTAGNAYHVETVLVKEYHDLTLTLSNSTIQPGTAETLEFMAVPKEKGQINGTIQLVMPGTEVRIPVVGVVLRSRRE